ncbi:MAG: hypothetical protein HY698_01280 [Deltaproteobacteria bacterium]|nr:hypothetical protein [Deltaproteobacteria bacterium]
MSGCTDCTALGGCGTRKDEQARLIDEIMRTVYPTRRWGEPDDGARHGRGVTPREAMHFARQASVVLEAPTYYREGSDAGLCDYVYVLCVGRPPGLLELREADSLGCECGQWALERYLRVAFSSVARIAAVQEVAFEMKLADDQYIIQEKPRGGIYDPVLLRRAQALLGLIVESKVAYLDFGLIARPAHGFAPGDYFDRYGQPPGLVNFMFYPEPPSAIQVDVIPCVAA